MKKCFLWILLLALLLITACDRYDKDYIIVPTASAFVESFTTNTETALESNNITQVMNYYADSYMNTGINKSAMQAFYTRAWSDSVTVQVTSINADSLKYEIHIIDNSKSVDTTWVDYAKKVNSAFLWIGNQQGAPAIPKQRALVQFITGTWCPNCPTAEAEIHRIYNTIPNQMTYLEYHINDTLAIAGTSNLMTYYGLNSAPTAIFQGQTILSGASDDVLSFYQGIITQTITTDAKVVLSNLNYTKNGNTLTGSVNISNLSLESLANCYLKAVIYEKETTALNYIQEPCSNVVRAQTTVALSKGKSRQSINFEMTSAKGIANDAYVVVWVQKIVDPNVFSNTTDSILNCIESQIR